MGKKESNFKSIIQLMKHFKDEETCREHLIQMRWNGNVVCPHCGIDKAPYVTNRGWKCSDSDCHMKFSATSGTIFDNTKLPLRTWFIAIYLCTSHKKSISSHQLAKDLDVTQNTAWFMSHRIREMFLEPNPITLSGVVETDETYIGGSETNKHLSKRLKDGRAAKGMTTVFGVIERGGKIVMQSVKNSKSSTLQPLLRKNVQIGSTIYSDEHVGYIGLEKDFNRGTVKHWEQEYVRGTVHTNTIEGAWSQFKRCINGTFHHVSPKHMDRYCTEFSGKMNTRDLTTEERFNQVISNCNGRILKYSQLIAA